MSKRIGSISLLTLAFSLAGAVASAQNADVFFGVATARDTSNNSLVDYFGTGTPLLAPKLDGTFSKIGADIMITKRFGIGGESDFQFSKSNYQGFQTRPIFYDFNGIYAPTLGRHSRVVPELQAGIGGVKMAFSYSQSQCDNLGGCSTSTVPYESSSHFQVHVAGGIRFYATKHIFVRPQVDFRYVPNFFQYGRNTVPEFGGVVGWSFSER